MSQSYNSFGGSHYPVLTEENMLRSIHPNSQCTTQVYGKQKQQKISFCTPFRGLTWPSQCPKVLWQEKAPHSHFCGGQGGGVTFGPVQPQMQSGCWKMERSVRLGMKERRKVVTGEESGTPGVTWDTLPQPEARSGHPLACNDPGVLLGDAFFRLKTKDQTELRE